MRKHRSLRTSPKNELLRAALSVVGIFVLISAGSNAIRASWLSNASSVDGAFHTSFLTASVTTDKRDYLPGDTVIITGSGYQAGETVTLQVVHIEGFVEPVEDTYTHIQTEGEGHEPWDVVADADGNISSTWYVHPDDSLGATFLLTAIGQTSGLTAQSTFTDGPFVLEGKCKDPAPTFSNCGTTSNPWIGGNLKGWKELENIPARVRFTGPVTNQPVTIEFDRIQTGFPGIENLTGFTSDTGVTFTTPVLSTPSAGKWAYSFTVTVINSGGGSVRFDARMSAGAHLISGSGLTMAASGGGGNLQISKPAAAPGNPDLTVTKSGPTSVAPNGLITYNLTYSNKTTATSPATGVQLVDTLPAGLTYEANSCTPATTNGANCVVALNTIRWDLGSLAPGEIGSASYQVRVSGTATNGQTLTNYAEINLAENDVTPADNYSQVTSTVSVTTVAPSITTQPASATKCVGDSVTFSVVADGTSPNYQWRKGGSPIVGATNSSYTISSVSATNAGSYDVVVSNSAGSATSDPATLVVNVPPSIGTQPLGASKLVGDSVTFSVDATGSNLTYQWRKGGAPISSATSSSYTISSVVVGDAGSYDVVVSGACSPSVTSSAAVLSVGKKMPVITWANPADITYGTALGATQLNATATYGSDTVAGSFSYTPASGTVLDAGNGQTLSLTFTPTDAGTYDTPAAANVQINVLKAEAVISVNGYTGTYDGAPHGATLVSATGVGGADLSASVTMGGQTFTSVPGGLASWSFSNPNYNNQSAVDVAIVINKADATINVTGYTGTYDGASHGAAGTATGVGGSDLSASLSLGASFTNVPGGTANWSFTGGTNYNNASGNAAIVINKALATATAGSGSNIYDGSSHSPSACAVTGAYVGDLACSNNPATAGPDVSTTAISPSVTGSTDNFEINSVNGTYWITKANATINVSGYSGTYDGAAHGATGTATGVGGANLSGSLALGATFMNVPGGSANWTFTGGTNYNDANGSVEIAIAKAASTTVVTFEATPYVYRGSAFTATALVTGAGALSESVAVVYEGDCTNVTSTNGCTAKATYVESANYLGSSDATSITINKATAMISVNGYTGTYDGAAHGASGTAAGIGGANLSSGLSLGNTFTAVPGGTASWTFNGGANYNSDSGSVAIVISKATSSTVVNCTSDSASYTGSAIEICSVSITGPGGLSLTPPAVYMNNVNVGTANASYTFAGDDNHEGSSGSDTFAITKAGSMTVVTCLPESATYTGAAIEVCSVSVTGTGGLSMTPNPSYSDNVNVGTASAGYTYTGDGNHEGSSGSDTFAITKAASTTVVTCTPESAVYTGSAIQICSVSVTGAGGLNLNPAPTYSDNINVGTATASYTYAGDGNHDSSNGSDTFSIGKAESTTVVTCTPDSVTYTGAALEICSVSVTGAGGLNLTPTPVYSNNVAVGTAGASYTYAGDNNHDTSNGSDTFAITKANQTIVFNTLPDKYYGNVGTVVSATGGGSSNPVTFGSSTPSVCTSAGTNGTAITFTGLGLCTVTASQAGSGNYNAASSVTRSFTVNLDTTTTTLDLSGHSLKVYDCERNVISATVRDTITGQVVPGVSVTLSIGTQSLVATTDNNGVASGRITLTQTVGGVIADAGFAGAGVLASSSANDQNVTIAPNTSVGPGRDATSLYTGSLWFWTTSSSSSTATLTLSATIANTGQCQGDIAKAKVSFLISTNGGTSFSPVSNAQNLPVGLVDPSNPNIGAASAISQYNIGNVQSVTLTVRVVVGGQYSFNQSTYDLPVSIGKPGTANSLMGGGRVDNNGDPFAASGYLGVGSIGSSFGSQVTYNKSGTNPQGQVTVYIDSYNKPDGTVDTGVLHKYFIKSNSISQLSMTNGAASFGSKTNVSELLPDGTKVGLDGGGTMQIVFTPFNKPIPRDMFVAGSTFVTNGNCNLQQGCMSIVAYRSAGGVWYSSSWGQGAGTTAPHTYVKPVLSGNIAVN